MMMTFAALAFVAATSEIDTPPEWQKRCAMRCSDNAGRGFSLARALCNAKRK